MAHIYTDIEINSNDIEKTWKILTDFESFPDWNPFVKKLEVLDESIKVGSKLSVNLDGFSIKPKVTKFSEENKEFSWLGKLFIPRIFDGEHMFKIERIDGNKLRFIQKEKFRGLLVWPILKLIGKQTQENFHKMNQTLKELVETS